MKINAKVTKFLVKLLNERDRELFGNALEYFDFEDIQEFFRYFASKMILSYKMRPICYLCEREDADKEAYSYQSNGWKPICSDCESPGWETQDLIRRLI